ncbi:hypothetical protein TeGR_g10714 [Tetraparma gracilis]|uniref:Vacuolar protein sorting-associated protein 13 VPS13 adaptor binding domain-containing protein n=1 Tax=Tetraparma gracilis TaxID=2962635 RepID=A0ABQ6N666_9STRA|nr:hypothetical protein TeGR_g10714 [Tetraparma gracilis]
MTSVALSFSTKVSSRLASILPQLDVNPYSDVMSATVNKLSLSTTVVSEDQQQHLLCVFRHAPTSDNAPFLHATMKRSSSRICAVSLTVRPSSFLLSPSLLTNLVAFKTATLNFSRSRPPLQPPFPFPASPPPAPSTSLPFSSSFDELSAQVHVYPLEIILPVTPLSSSPSSTPAIDALKFSFSSHLKLELNMKTLAVAPSSSSSYRAETTEFLQDSLILLPQSMPPRGDKWEKFCSAAVPEKDADYCAVLRRLALSKTTLTISDVQLQHASLLPDRLETVSGSEWHVLSPFVVSMSHSGAFTSWTKVNEAPVNNLAHSLDCSISSIDLRTFYGGSAEGVMKTTISPCIAALKEYRSKSKASSSSNPNPNPSAAGTPGSRSILPPPTPATLATTTLDTHTPLQTPNRRSPVRGSRSPRPRLPATPGSVASYSLMSVSMAPSLLDDETATLKSYHNSAPRQQQGKYPAAFRSVPRSNRQATSSPSRNHASAQVSALRALVENSVFRSHVVCKGFQLTLVPGSLQNNSAPPLLRATASSVTFKLTSHRSRVAALLRSADFTLDYHNRGLVAWEPFVEPWSFKVHLILDVPRLTAVGSECLESTSMKLFGCEEEQEWFLRATRSRSRSGGGSTSEKQRSGRSKKDQKPSRGHRQAGSTPSSSSALRQQPAQTGKPAAAPPPSSTPDPDRASRASSQRSSKGHVVVADPFAPINLCNTLDIAYLLLQLITADPSALPPAASSSSSFLSYQNLLPPTLDIFAPASQPRQPVLVSLVDEQPLNVNITSALIHQLAVLRRVSEQQQLGKRGSVGYKQSQWIVNNTGVPLAFWEDEESGGVGAASAVTLQSGAEGALLLSEGLDGATGRALTRSYITIDFPTSTGKKGGRLWKRLRRIPVDRVGVYEHRIRADQTKLISVESPLQIKNRTPKGIPFEVRDSEKKTKVLGGVVAPDSAYFVPFSLLAAAPMLYISGHNVGPLVPPVSASKEGRSPAQEFAIPGPESFFVNVSACTAEPGLRREIEIRPPYAIRNFLALPIDVQVGDSNVGVVGCGETRLFSGLSSADGVELRVRFVGDKSSPDKEAPAQFPSWSDCCFVEGGGSGADGEVAGGGMRIEDYNGIVLPLSVRVSESDDETAAAKTISVHVPFWVIDATGLRLELMTRSKSRPASAGVVGAGTGAFPLDDQKNSEFVVGQRFRARHAANNSSSGGGGGAQSSGNLMGLKGLLDKSSLSRDEQEQIFNVHMVGQNASSALCVRNFAYDGEVNEKLVPVPSPWSTQIPLKLSRDPQAINVKSPRLTKKKEQHPLALCSMVVRAPASLGGEIGTSLVYLVNRFTMVNFLGRELEIGVCRKDGRWVEGGDDDTTVLPVDGSPTALHYDDRGCVRFRPTEYGWGWSGAFRLVRKQGWANAREMTIRLRNELTGAVLIASVEFGDAGQRNNRFGVNVVFRKSECPPFRLENHTLHPLCMYQGRGREQEGRGGGSSPDRGGETAREPKTSDVVLLPYHTAPYAWDDPDSGSGFRCLVIETAAGGGGGRGGGGVSVAGGTVGRFDMDSLAPSSTLLVEHDGFHAEIIADGPTRVLRITDSSLPKEEEEGAGGEVVREGGSSSRGGAGIDVMAVLTFGVGVSLVDSSPSELLFMKFSDIVLRRELTDGGEGFDSVVLCVRKMTFDNQLWLTPFPALVRGREGRGVGRGAGGVIQDIAGASDVGRLVFGEESADAAIRVKWCKDLRYRNRGSASVSLVKDLTVLVSPLDVRVDGALALRVIDMAGILKLFKRESVQAAGFGGSRDDMLLASLGDKRDILSLKMRRAAAAARMGAGAGGGGGGVAGLLERGRQETAPREVVMITATEAISNHATMSPTPDALPYMSSGGDDDTATTADDSGMPVTRLRRLSSNNKMYGGMGMGIRSPKPGPLASSSADGAADKSGGGGGGGGGGRGGEAAHKVYFENIHISPISLRLSFTLPPTMFKTSSAVNMSAGMSAVIGFLSMTNITSIDSAPVTLRGFTRSHIFGTRQDHLQTIVGNYKSLLWGQATLLALSSELLGNPLKMLRAARDGVNDFSNELAEGYGNGNVLGAVWGGARGLVMIVRNVSYGWLTSVGKSLSHTAVSVCGVTGSLVETKMPAGAEGRVARKWMESADVEGIAMARRRNVKPKDRSLEWMRGGGGGKVVPNGIVEGVFQALAGLLSEPVAQSQNVVAGLFLVGALRGVFRGVLGGGVKILVGGLKTLGGGSERLARVVGGGDVIVRGEREREAASARVRAPRYFGDGGGAVGTSLEGNLLVPFEEGENVGFELLSRVEGGLFLSDGYLAHGDGCAGVEGGQDKGRSMIAIVTARRCLLVHEEAERFCALEWQVEPRRSSL